MPQSSVEKLAHAGRALLAVGSLMAFGSAALWNWKPEWIEAYEAERRDSELAPATELLERAQEAHELHDNQTAMALYEELAKSLEGVRPGERLEDPRAAALQGITELHAGQHERLAAAEAWTAFDPRSAPALMERACALYALPELRQRGLEQMQALFAQLPETAFVTEAWTAMLASEGRFKELIEALALHYERLESSHWKLTWQQPSGATQRGLLMAIRSGPDLSARAANAQPSLRIEWNLEAPVGNFRLYLPPHASMTLIDSGLTVFRGAEQLGALEVAADGVYVNRMAQSPAGRELKSREIGDAYFEFKLPPELVGSDQRYVFRAQLGEPPCELLTPFLGDPEFTRACAELQASGATEIAQWALAAQLNAVAATKFQLFYRTEDEGFGEQRSTRVGVGGAVKEGQLVFSTRLELADSPTQLRLDFPDSVGLRWNITKLVIEHPAGEQSVPLAQLLDNRSRGLEFAGSTWTVLQPDPWVEFECSVAEASALRIEGSVR